MVVHTLTNIHDCTNTIIMYGVYHVCVHSPYERADCVCLFVIVSSHACVWLCACVRVCACVCMLACVRVCVVVGVPQGVFIFKNQYLRFLASNSNG